MTGDLAFMGPLCGADVCRLQTFGALLDSEFDLLAFGQGLVARHLNGGEVDEDIRAAITLDEAEALARIEPLHGADDAFAHCCIYSLN